jgi:hypothetical protein
LNAPAGFLGQTLESPAVRNSNSITPDPRRPIPLNKPIDPDDYVYVVELACVGENWDPAPGEVHLSPALMRRYNRDPDLFAAQYFEFTSVETYREWIECKGVAYCGAVTRSGFCKCPTSDLASPLNAAAWRKRHREHLCTLHANRQKAQP